MPVSGEAAGQGPPTGGVAPSQEDQGSPHAGDLVVGVGLDHSPAFLERAGVLLVCGEQEDQVIGKFPTVGLTSHEPSKLGLFLCNP
jgi:hypothetical protein